MASVAFLPLSTKTLKHVVKTSYNPNSLCTTEHQYSNYIETIYHFLLLEAMTKLYCTTKVNFKPTRAQRKSHPTPALNQAARGLIAALPRLSTTPQVHARASAKLLSPGSPNKAILIWSLPHGQGHKQPLTPIGSFLALLRRSRKQKGVFTALEGNAKGKECSMQGSYCRDIKTPTNSPARESQRVISASLYLYRGKSQRKRSTFPSCHCFWIFSLSTCHV